MERPYIETNDLISRYVRNRLAPDEAEQFELAYFRDPILANLVAVEQSLLEHCASDRAKPQVSPLPELTGQRPADRYVPLTNAHPSSRKPFYALAACLILSVGILGVVLRNGGETPPELQIATAVQLNPVRSEGRQVDQSILIPSDPAQWVVLQLMPLRKAYPSVRVSLTQLSILNVQTVDYFDPTTQGLSLIVPGDSLVSGRYRVEVIAPATDEGQVLQQFTIEARAAQ